MGDPLGIAEDAARPVAVIRFTSAVEQARAGLEALRLTPTSHGYSREVLQRLSGICASYDADGFETRAAPSYPDRGRFRQDVELAIALTEGADGLAD